MCCLWRGANSSQVEKQFSGTSCGKRQFSPTSCGKTLSQWKYPMWILSVFFYFLVNLTHLAVSHVCNMAKVHTFMELLQKYFCELQGMETISVLQCPWITITAWLYWNGSTLGYLFKLERGAKTSNWKWVWLPAWVTVALCRPTCQLTTQSPVRLAL